MSLVGQTLVLLSLVAAVWSHGYMLDPVGRNAMWKYGFKGAPINYSKNGLYCGGVGVSYFLLVFLSFLNNEIF